MYILGDIGNTETKIYLVSSKDKILKKIFFSTKKISQARLSKFLSNLKLDYKQINKILFVV